MISPLRWIAFSTWVVVLLGLVSVWQIHLPDDGISTQGALRIWATEALDQPLVWLLGTVALIATFLGRRFDATARNVLPSESGYAIDLPELDGRNAVGDRPERRAPSPEDGGTQRARDLLRIRLEALLRGDPDVPEFVDQLLGAAVALGASDIHIEPRPGESRISFRHRGRLEEIATIPLQRHPEVARRLKVMATLPPYVSDRPQDGQISLRTPRGPRSLRLSIVPSVHGEKVALRLAGDASSLRLEELGLETEQLDRLADLLQRPQGLFLLTGPTGSGKTTTLYSALEHVHRTRGERVQLAAIEDPIEVELAFVNQTQVDRGRGLGFAEALRALLRQDPNVLMIGEIRDGETARVAIQAGLSGHLVLTTLHSDSAIGVFPRLIDLGVEPFLAASATLASLSQRLVRRLCPSCRHQKELTPALRERLADRRWTFSGQPWEAEGCRSCDYKGYDGRIAVFEILELDGPLRQAITRRAPMVELQEMLEEKDHVGLVRAGLRLAERGETTLAEILGMAP